MNDRRDSAPIIVGMFLLFFVLICAITSISFVSLGKVSSGGKFSMSSDKDLIGANVGLIEIEGPIAVSKDKVKNINRLAEKENIKAIFLYINTPGGGVGATEEIYRALLHAKEKGKKIYVCMGALCASGGYFLASAADEIFTTESTLTGSVGVIMSMMNLKELYKFVKVDMVVFKSGKYKDIGNPARAMTDEEKKFIEGLVSKTFDIFFNVVFEGRKEKIKAKFPEKIKTDEDVKNYLKEYTQGQIILGKDAVEIGLADRIGVMEDMKKYAEKELGVPVKVTGEPRKNKFQVFFEEMDQRLGDVTSGKAEKTELLFMAQ
mgnify:CR=1 FL=1